MIAGSGGDHESDGYCRTPLHLPDCQHGIHLRKGDTLAHCDSGDRAEVLVPQHVSKDKIVGAYVPCDDAYYDMMALEVPWPVTQYPDIFFQEESDVW